MPVTYSLSVGLTTEAERKQDITSVLVKLPDNTQKLITPKDVRDAFTTAWATSAFKQTIGPAQVEYIGIDSGNPNNRDIKQKILLGKRSNSFTDVMNSTLLNSDTDIFFYNTKPDTSLTQSITRVSILAGTNSTLYQNAPYIQSQTILGGNAYSFDLINPSINPGPININSSSGRVSVNGILFPTIAETSASASNGRILRYSGTYPNGGLKWSDSTVTLAEVGSPGSPTNIYGSPVNLNGYSLEFVETRQVPKTIGGIKAGRTFASNSFSGQNWPLSEVLRDLLYFYQPPGLSISFTNPITGNNWAEVGVTSSLNFTYSISLYSNDVNLYRITGTTYSNLSYTGNPGDVLTKTFTYGSFSSTPATTKYFVLQASDSGLSTFSHSSTASIIFVSPIYASFSSSIDVDLWGGSSATRASQCGDLIDSGTKKIVPYLNSGQSITVPYNGTGFVYFLMPSSYPLLSKIKDQNGYTLHSSSDLTNSSFTYSSSITPTGNSVNQGNYLIYKSKLQTTYNGNFEFIF